MTRIFISHTSQNNNRAIQLRDWLVANGWDDFFLDLDPEQGIAPGEKWKETLRAEAHRCEAVIALVSPEWLARSWCLAELNTAELMGKKIIVLLIGSKPSDLPGDLTDVQYFDLLNDPDAYTRLKEGLKRAGLDPVSFPFAEGRRPYPGLTPLEEDDAAIFFGRDAQIVRELDKLRWLTRAGVERMLIILGASGCGKSSFLRAGLWPRLKRDDRTWLPLPTIRPERAVISGKFGLVQSLYGIMNEAPFAEKLQKQELPRSCADIEAFVTTHDDGLPKILAALREAGRVPGLSGEETQPPTIVIPIDQGEELFDKEGEAEDRRFIDILTKTLAADPNALALFTMRTDSFPQFQNDPALAAVPKEIFTLDRMLEGSYREVIEGPAALVKPKPLKIDPELTEALLQDAAGQDALALLAFTLRYLYDKYQADNELTLEGYKKLDRLTGVIESAVSQALEDGVARGELPKDRGAQLALIRRAFIPHLARVNPASGQFVRRVASRGEIPPEAQPLIDRLAEARLLIKDRREVGGEKVEVIEVAHEALLREWRDLNTALREDREFLDAKGQLELDVADWQATPEGQKKGALLAGNKLTRAQDWLIKRPQGFTADERNFIQTSANVRTAGLRRAAIGGLALMIVFAALAVFGWGQAQSANERLNQSIVNQSRFLAALARQASQRGDYYTALALALKALPAVPPRSEQRTQTAAEAILYSSMAKLQAGDPEHPEPITVFFSPDGGQIATVSRAKIVITDTATNTEVAQLAQREIITAGAFSDDGTRIATASLDNTVRLWDALTGAELRRLVGHSDSVDSVAFSPNSALLVTTSWDNTARVWSVETGQLLHTLVGHTDAVLSGAFSPDGTEVVTGSKDYTARVWDAATGALKQTLLGNHEEVIAAEFSLDGYLVGTATRHAAIKWDAYTGRMVYRLDPLTRTNSR